MHDSDFLNNGWSFIDIDNFTQAFPAFNNFFSIDLPTNQRLFYIDAVGRGGVGGRSHTTANVSGGGGGGAGSFVWKHPLFLREPSEVFPSTSDRKSVV